MSKMFTLLFAALAIVCLVSVIMAGRYDYIILCLICGIAALVNHIQHNLDKEAGHEC